MHLSEKFTLSIDPENQALNFLKKLKSEVEGKKIIKLNAVTNNPDQDMKQLKLAIKSGYTVLYENVQDYLSHSLEPILNKKIVKRGA